MKLSVYTSLFNYDKGLFDLVDAFDNWSNYANEIVVSTFEDQHDEIMFECIDAASQVKKDFNLKIVSTKDTDLNDPLFDGKLKDLALKNCSSEIVIQQDADERIGGLKKYWLEISKNLLQVLFPVSVFIPVIDLYKDYKHYKSLSYKWYIHTKRETNRGVVNFARREDGTVDVDKSDSCELINDNGDLIPSTTDHRFVNTNDVNFPHVIHLGYVDLNNRCKNNKFREKCWTNLNGSEIKVATDIESLESENTAIPHAFKEGWWKYYD